MRVATYTRISTDEVRQPYSLDAQADRLGAYIKSQDGWELARAFTDQCSGATLERPALQQALREASLHRYDLLLVYRVDRLARSVRGLAHILETLDASSVAFRSATEPFDTSTSAGRMMVQMLGVFAEFERATIVDRVIAGMERKASNGRWTSGSRPFGYTVDAATGFLSPREDEAPLVPLIFEKYAQKRLGVQSIGAWLTQRGHRTRKGLPWNAKAVLTLLRNRAYIGEVYFRGSWHAAPHPKLVELGLFETAGQILEERGENWSLRASNPSEYLLAGVVTCARCGRHYIGSAAHGKRNRYRYYNCWSRQRYGTDHCDGDRLPADDLEQAVVDALDHTYAQDDLVRKAVEATRVRMIAARPGYEDQLAQVGKEMGKAESALERYLAAFETGTIPETVCGHRVRDIDAKLTALRLRRTDLMALIEDAPPIPEAVADIEAVRRSLAEVFGEAGEPSTRKALLQTLIADVRIQARDDITPTFNVLLQPGVRAVGGLVPVRGVEPRLPP